MITLKTKVKDIMLLSMDTKTLSSKCKWKPWSIASEMTLDEFLQDQTSFLITEGRNRCYGLFLNRPVL